jgi:uncharacterized protein (TIGR02265 family)
MIITPASLEALLARVSAKDTVRGFVSNAILGHVERIKGAPVASGVLERVLRKRPNDLLSYPAPDFFRLLIACTEAIALPGKHGEALHDLGHAAAAGFFVSPMGKVLLSIVGKGNPPRLMANEPTAYATSFTFGKRRYEKIAAREFALVHQEDLLPVPFNVGALEAAVESVGEKAQVTVTELGADSARYVLRW